MAITQNPLIGRSSGKFAGAVFSTSYGKNIIRSKPVEVRDAQSESQVNQRNKFKVAQQWVIMFLSIIRTGFANYKTNMSAYAAALGWYLKNAVVDSGGTWVIDYANAVFSFGELLPESSVSILSATPTGLSLSLSNSSGNGNALASDIPIMIAYCPTTQALLIYNSEDKREDQWCAVDTTLFSEGDLIHVWAFWVREDGSMISDTIYVGSTTVAA
jgi:hypothetical protein